MRLEVEEFIKIDSMLLQVLVSLDDGKTGERKQSPMNDPISIVNESFDIALTHSLSLSNIKIPVPTSIAAPSCHSISSNFHFRAESFSAFGVKSEMKVSYLCFSLSFKRLGKEW